MQGITRNPLADPYLIGVASGAGLGAVLAMASPLSTRWLGLFSVPAVERAPGVVDTRHFAPCFGTVIRARLARFTGSVPPGRRRVQPGALTSALDSRPRVGYLYPS